MQENFWKLPKELLIEIIKKGFDLSNYSDEVLQNELNRRTRLRRNKIICDIVLKLKVVPHLKDLIEKHEKLLKDENIDLISELSKRSGYFKEFSNYFLFPNWYANLTKEILSNHVKAWINSESDEVVYNKCILCDNYEIIFKKNNKIITVECFTDKYGRGSDDIESTFLDQKCLDCQ